MEKILITGTGRCGTTFLIKLFSFLDFNTGYNEGNYSKYIFPNCNSGMEKGYNQKYYILKNPTFIKDIKTIIDDPTIKIKTVIIPMRDFKSAAISRVNNGNKTGGLWHATDEKSQQEFYEHLIANYVYYMTKYDINTIFIDFDKMISDKKYLFNKIKCILDEKNIDFDLFSNIYDKVSLTSQPKP